MKKKSILNALNALGAHCQTADENDALDILIEVANNIEEESASKPQAGFGEFVLADEVIAKKAFSLYSDGACRGNPGPGAWGIVAQDPNGEIIFEDSGFENNTTNNRMELDGAIKSLEQYKSHIEANAVPIDWDVFLYSDSKYVLDGLEKWVPGWKARGWKKADKKTPENVERWQRLDALRLEFPNLHLRWVKGHSGHPQNERCDQLANLELDQAGF